MKRVSIIIIIVIIFINIIFSFSRPISAQASLNQLNQKVSSRFETDVLKLAAIMEELRRRQGITETRVAFGGIETEIENADYWVTYAAEAVAFQKAQKYSSKSQLRSSLEVLKNKILRAKNEVRKALNDE